MGNDMSANPMQLHKSYQLQQLSDFDPLVQDLCGLLKSGDELGLVGPLGIGKTCLVGILAKALGVKEPVSSPSYVLSHEYTTASGLLLEHWDLYRIKELPEELYEPVRPGSIRLIEWANKMIGYRQNLDWLLQGEFEEGERSQTVSAAVVTSAGSSSVSLQGQSCTDPVPQSVLRQWRLYKRVS